MTQAAGPDQRPLLVLVDNDAAVCDALRFHLELEGYAVTTFRDAASVLAAAFVIRPSCLVIDFDLPDMDGLTLLHRLREQDEVLPAVLIASQLAPRFRAQAAADSLLVVDKPLMENELVVAVARAVLAASASA